MGNKKIDTNEDIFKDLGQTVSRSEKFVESNKKVISISLISAVLIFLLYVGYTNYYKSPREIEAINDMDQAKVYFSEGNFDLALDGDGQFSGFNDIIEKYSSTSAANLSRYYAGMIYLKKSEYEKSINLLQDYYSKDIFSMAIAKGGIGDAFSQLKQYDKALTSYREAVSISDNDITAPTFLMKGAIVALELKKYSVATEMFTTIKDKFPKSAEAKDVEKYIELSKYSALANKD
ncbi:tetratricopeptide repeat protein [Ichthyobacterium seriolicida]|uniref:Uncharacterized protein n=1 Tax=Ichthyobacterium seriolicida TaxID=242600 RepID=A0A1J1E538_9FLAO|nr:tetratricopeptide repeat protein [Ichthyobacterium seriolicida]BAV95172.1 hypothetical protein JBKA6_1159 [Ichthyobacterium seriolicida]